MDSLLLLLRLALAGIFFVSGVAKLVDLPGSQRALVDFGVPARLAGVFGLVLPFAELGAALLLLPASTAWWGAMGVLALLLVFMTGISINMARGRTPDCHCFGQLHSKPIGWSTLGRNGLFLAMALTIAAQGPRRVGFSAVSWLGDLSTTATLGLGSSLLILALLLIQGWISLQLLRQNGRLLLRVEALEAHLNLDGAAVKAVDEPAGLPVGETAPAFRLPSVSGEIVSLDELRTPSKPVVLVFSDPKCNPCNQLLPEIAQWQHKYANKLTIVTISRGSVKSNRAKCDEHGLDHVLLQIDNEIGSTYLARATPSAVVVAPDGTIKTPLALGAEAIRTLIDVTAHPGKQLRLLLAPVQKHRQNIQQRSVDQAPVVMHRRGQPAPHIELATLTGEIIDLAAPRDKPTLVVFWNPRCGFCQRMLPDLQQWEAHPQLNTVELVVVSSGTAEMNQALELQSTIVLDDTFAVGQIFGATGTPSAVLIAADGNVASSVVVGGPAVMALARSGSANTEPATHVS